MRVDVPACVIYPINIDLTEAATMITQYDKAIAAFLTSLAGLGAAFGLSKYLTWLNQDTILAITPFVTMIVTWLVPNKPA
jgi:hypothetical protein